MNANKLLVAAALGFTSLIGLSVIQPSTARAQSSTTGAIRGVVTDKATGEKLAAVTVLITSPALSQTQSTLTDGDGFYIVNELPPGDYLVTFFYLDFKVEQSGVHVGVNKASNVYQQFDLAAVANKGETIHVTAKAPLVDTTSTNQGITLDKQYLQNIPVPGRTFDAALGAAAGSQSDGVGVSFSGSSSLENQYIVDGVNTTGLTLGTVGSPVVNDFIEEIEVITGGYNAEYGRATGGVVNVVTKTGSNEFKGSVWGYYQPGFLTAAQHLAPVNASSIDAVNNVNYNGDFGFELGGPIIKDKLWFFIGFDPTFVQNDITRTVKSQTDCRMTKSDGTQTVCNPKLVSQGGFADGVADVDPKTGFYITDTVDSQVRSATAHTYNILGKINYAATPEHQGQISFEALPSASSQPGIFGPADNGFKTTDTVLDLAGKWTSKFNDNKTEVEAIVGWHHEYTTSDALDPSLEQQPAQALTDGSLGLWSAGYEPGNTNVAKGCTDGPPGSNDVYPYITNCPMTGGQAYVIGGPGFIQRDTEERKSAALRITERFKAAGSHEIKAGIDAEDNTTNKARLLSGGGEVEFNDIGASQIETIRYAQLIGQQTANGGQGSAPTNNDPSFFNQTCTTPNPNPTTTMKVENFDCAYLGGTPGSRATQIQGETFNWAAYVRDSWQIQPNLTLNAGLRYEEQRLRYASFLQGTVDPLTGDLLGKNAMTLTGNYAPRIGLLYDWTKEGRSKIYANWGRFYESIPLDINNRSFGGEVEYEQLYTSANCTPNSGIDPKIGGINGNACLTTTNPGNLKQNLVGASGDLVAPGIKAQYMDEIVAGFEYEVIDDLKVGVSYQNRSLGRVIEDVSTDGANTYIISNPGEFSQSEAAAFQQRINMTDDPAEKARLTHQLQLFNGINIFDHPSRVYNALQFTLTRRFSKKLYLQASYTYSRTEGNYPGLVSYDNGQLDPNISSQFDLIELLANHAGPLPTDRPHYIKIDGYYTFDLKQYGDLTVGVRFRALSGIPEDALAGHWLYGPNESFLLPRGELGRSDFDHGLDVHVGYGRKLKKNMKLEVFADIYNVYNDQGTANVDNNYAPYYKLSSAGMPGVQQNANPIAGGTYSDLIWLKTVDQNGVENGTPIGRNPNFHNPIALYAPLSARLGVRLTF